MYEPAPISFSSSRNSTETKTKSWTVMSSTNSYRSLSTCAKFLAFVEYMRFCEAQFLQVAVGSSVSRQSAEWVLAQLQAMARVSTHGGYDPTMTTDPFIVSKALHHSSRLRESEPCCDFIHSCRHAPLPWPPTCRRSFSSGGGSRLAAARPSTCASPPSCAPAAT